MLATEILENADDIADLTNSDFMSGKQKNRILNENYRAIYQKIVNHGDRYLLQVLQPNEEGKYILPSDFYQLHSITAGDGAVQVPRKVIGMGDNASGYIITKDEIIIKGYSDVEILYYPSPEKLYTATEEILRPYYPGIPYREGYPEVLPVPPVHRDAREWREGVYRAAVPAVSASIEVVAEDVYSNASIYNDLVTNSISINKSSGARAEKYEVQSQPITNEKQIKDLQGNTVYIGANLNYNKRYVGNKNVYGINTLFTCDSVTNGDILDTQEKYDNFFTTHRILFCDNLSLIDPNNFSFFYCTSFDETEKTYKQSKIILSEYDVNGSCIINNSAEKDLLFKWYYYDNGGVHIRASKNQVAIMYRLAHHGSVKNITEWRITIFDFVTEVTRTLYGGVDFDDAKTVLFTEVDNKLVCYYTDMSNERKAWTWEGFIDWTFAGYDIAKTRTFVLQYQGVEYYARANESGILIGNNWIGTSDGMIYPVRFNDCLILGVKWQNKFQVFDLDGNLFIDDNNISTGVMGNVLATPETYEGNTIVRVKEYKYFSARPGLMEIDIPEIPAVEAIDLEGLEGRPEIPEIQAIPPVEEVVDVLNTDVVMRNNLFFDVLAYMCALQYKQKQNADTTAIKEQLAEKMEVFFDTLTEDDYERLRVRNVY